MSARRVIIRGESLRAAIAGSLVARACSGLNLEVHIEFLPLQMRTEAGEGETFVLRPDVHRFHGELGLDAATLHSLPHAAPCFAVTAGSSSGEASLPFANFGQARAGIEFHQLWTRASGAGLQPDLLKFSPSIALQNAAESMDLRKAYKLSLPFGLTLPTAHYADLLMALAKQAGAFVHDGLGKQVTDADLIIDCSPTGAANGWSANRLAIAEISGVPGLEWQYLYQNSKRAVSLGIGSLECDAARSEFNRLTKEEVERIADFHELLKRDDLQETTRPALKRKIDVFEACGRIPMEDYEVAQPCEWLAALWARGLRPRRCDRRAEALSLAELRQFLDKLREQVNAIESGAALR
ncbi:MAG: tryptophan 7-halogenase [Erythrobacter sp.]|uniref:tryptophan 7-halogenase n=1 Tax=Erythrobacter sp. TaxID=1042 RepID=UPI0032648515